MAAKLYSSNLLLALLAFVAGCSWVSVQSKQYLGVPTYPPTDPAAVEILRSEPLRLNERLGEITLEPQGNPTVQEMEAKLRQAAAKMGADAVVIVADRTMLMGGVAMGPWWGRQLNPVYGRVIVGVAIRYVR
jgi:hypothetical protein